MILHRFFLSVLYLIACLPCQGDTSPNEGWQHALSLNASPKHPAHFQYFDQVNPEAPKGGHLRLGVHGTFDTLNPYINKGTPPSKALWAKHYGFLELNEPLMVGYGLYAPSFDELDTCYGLIAKAVKLNPERTRLEFRLRQSARFHDGHPITSQDVAFSVKQLTSTPIAQFNVGLDRIERVETPTPHHVIFHIKPDSAQNLPLILATLPVLPEHYWRHRDFNKTTLEPPLLRTFCASLCP